MPRILFFLALFTLILAEIGIAPTAAMAGDSTQLAAQSRPRITIHPRRHYPAANAKRYCRSWLQKEYRVSGPVIVPQMYCWWG